MARRRWWVIGLGVVGGVAGLSLLGLLGAGLWLRTDAGNEWVRRKAVEALATGDTQASIGAIHTDLWTGARIEDFELTMPGMVIRIGQLDADIDRGALWRRELVFTHATAEGVLVDLTASEPSDEPAEPFSGIGVDLTIEDIDLRGAQVVYRSADGAEVVRVVGASGSARFQATGPELRVEDLDLTALVGLMGSVAAHVKGEVVVDAAGTHLNELDVRLPRSVLAVDGSIEEELDLGIAIDHVAASDLDALLGRPGLAGNLAGEVKVTGPTDQIAWSATLRGIDQTRGSAVASGTVDLRAERLGWTVDAELEGLDANQLYPGIGESMVLSGHAVVDASGTAWPDDLVLDLTWDGRSHDAFGQHVDAAHAEVRLEKGAVILENTTLDGILGELSLSGRIETVSGPMDVHATGWIRPKRLRELGVSGVDSSGWLDARITGDLSDPDAPIRVAGTVRFAPFRSGDSIVFDSAVARFEATARGEVVDGTAHVEASGGNVGGIEIAEAFVDTVRFHTGPDGLDVTGDVTARTVSLPDTFQTSVATGIWSLNDAGATARIELGSLDLLGMHGTRGSVSVDQKGDLVGLRVRLDEGDRALVQTEGRFDLKRSAIALESLLVAPTPRAEWRNTRPLSFTLTDGGLTEADIALKSAMGSIEVTGTAGIRGPLDARIAVTDLELAALTDLDPEAFGELDGTVQLSLVLGGRADQPEIQGTLDARRLTVGESLQGLDAEGTIRATHDALSAAIDLGVAGTAIGRVHGAIPLKLDLADPALDPDGTVALTAAFTPGSLDRVRTLAPAAADLPKGRAGGVLELSGRFGDPDLRLSGIAELDVPGWLEPQRTEFEVTRAGGALSGWADARMGYLLLGQLFGMAQTELSRAIEPALTTGAVPEDFDWTSIASDLYLTGVVLDVPVSGVAALAGQSELPLQGHLTGGFQITGTAAKPAFDGTINWVEGKIGREPVEGLDLIIGHTEEGYDLDLAVAFADEVAFRAKGTVPVKVDLREPSKTWATEPMALTLGGAVPMRAVTAFTRSVGKSSGKLEIGGTVGGTIAAPDPRIALSMADGAMTVGDLGLRLEDLVLDATASKDGIRLNELSGTTRPSKQRLDLQEAINSAEKAISELDDEGQAARPSSFKVVGDVALVDNAPQEVSLRIRLDQGTWLIATGDTAVRADGKIRVSGTYPALVAGGNLTLRQGLVKLDAAAFVDRAPLEPDPRIHIARRTLGEPEEESSPPWYSQATAAIDLDLRRALELEVAMPFVDDLGSIGAFVSRADLNARLGGQSTLTMAEGELSMVGELDLVDGRLKMLGRRFDVQSGRIVFTGGDIAEPRLDITSKTTVANIPVTATVSGTPSAPEISPECEGYPSESDCLTILVTGRAPDEEGSGNTAAALAGMALGGLLGEQNFADISFEPDGSVQAGAALTNSVYVTYTLDSRPDIGENQNTFEADLGLARRVVWNLAWGDQESWTDLFWEIRF